MVTYTIRKSEGEYQVRFRVNGVRRPSWDYFTTDKVDAKRTAEATVTMAANLAAFVAEEA